ncbi:hypothetical protein GCM10011487_56050 [Steroidobacter agaridevorans]|uniref:Ice-binding protein C-terminal domain-containing protein n=1 Tax=Steroidobacter agaridevorans TaxID=2695856 RepID=A0A829YJW7_9GAMM|nr:PEP-CTERM sorting domain-containing protein [Steroidobacter agaridevorans]GFE83605.1 hypothetical protein GCM10011487_56050 [Steroidobacter agaridevorans]
MSKKSWVAMTGLCVLMATSAAQAHLIPICVEAYESGTEVSGAVDGATRTHVTFTRASRPAGAAPAVGMKSNEKAGPYWSASSGPLGNCQQLDISSSHARSRPLPEGVGPDAGVRLMPVTAVLMDTSVDPAAESNELDVTGQAHSIWGWAPDGGGNRAGLTGASTFSQGLGQQSSAAGNNSLIPWQTSHGSLGFQAGRPNPATGNSTGNNTGNNNGTIGRTPAGGTDGHSVGGGVGDDGQATQVPEPETLALLMVGLLGVALTSRRRRELAATG